LDFTSDAGAGALGGFDMPGAKTVVKKEVKKEVGKKRKK
jgi:hypothetical protein